MTEGLSGGIVEAAGTPSRETAGGGRAQWIVTAAVVAVAIAVYTPILRGLVGNWSENEDYSHGFLIVPLAIYFLWERRDRLASLPVITSKVTQAPIRHTPIPEASQVTGDQRRIGALET